MIDDPRGRIDYDEGGSGTTVVFVPGSCSTGAGWRPTIAAMGEGYRWVTTSLLGYGGTAERRTESDPSIAREVDVLAAVVRKAGAPLHLVGHSWGGLVALAFALRDQTALASLTVIEAPAAKLLSGAGDMEDHATFHRMVDAYFAAFAAGDENAIATMIDFYAGAPGTFAAWPPRVRAYAIETTAVNIRDWKSWAGFPLSPEMLAGLSVPTLVIRGGASPKAMQRANGLLAESIPGARMATVAGAAHFMIATHPADVARLISRHVATNRAATAY